SCSLASSANAQYYTEIARYFGLENRWTLLLQGTTETVGLSHSRLREIAKSAALLLNISGMLQEPDLVDSIPCPVYLDLDPAFNQLWQATQGIDMHLAAHNCFVTVGNSIGRPTCPVPTCGVQWITTFQPVVLHHWPVGDTICYEGLTTIGNWR